MISPRSQADAKTFTGGGLTDELGGTGHATSGSVTTFEVQLCAPSLLVHLVYKLFKYDSRYLKVTDLSQS